MKSKYTLFLIILLFSAVFTSKVSAQNLKVLISGFSYNYELPAHVHLPEGYKNYQVIVQSDNNIASEERILFLKDSVRRAHATQEERQAAFQQALKRENVKLAGQKLNEKLSPYYIFNIDKEPDFAVKLSVSNLQHEIVEDTESDTIMRLSYEAEVHLVDTKTNEVYYSQSVSESPEKQIMTRASMILFFTPDELLKLKFKKKDIELKKTIYQAAVERLNRSILQDAIDSAASVLEYQLIPLRQPNFALYSATKKYDYEKLGKAEEIMKEISKVRKLRVFEAKTTMSREEEISNLHEAIAIWEEELSTEDRTNDKARINAIIGEGLRYNCALAYMLMYDFDKANGYVEQMNTKQPTVVSKPEHNLPKFASDLKYLIAESELRLGDKQ